MAYQYVAYTPQGTKIQGRVDAESESAAEEILWKQDYTIAQLKEIRNASSSSLFTTKIKKRDLVVFCRQLATLIGSGIPIVRALHLLQEQVQNKKLRDVLSEVIVDVQQGHYFSEAILKHNDEFPELFGRLIEVGEQAGNLELVLEQLATYFEKDDALVRKVRGAMAYPTFVILMAIGVLFLMLVFAMPPLMSLFESFNAELPLPTKILLALTKFTSSYKWFILAGLISSITGLVLFARSKAGKPVIDKILLKIPLVGRIVTQGAVARMCRSMNTLLVAGVALPEILQLIIRTQSNSRIKDALEVVRNELLQGNGLADPLSNDPVFPGMLTQMVRVGEETGSLDDNMGTLAVFYEDEVDRLVGALSGVLEQAMTVGIGVMVGCVASAVVMPMYSLMGQM